MAVRTTKTKKQIKQETVETHIARIVVDNEYKIGKENIQGKISDFEAFIDILECERTEKNADWMSDIFFPEFTAQMLTQSSIEANQYFQTKDFVEVYLEDESDEAIAKAEANKELINRTLNQRHLYHYQKFMRANITKNISGEVYAQCGWQRNTNVRLTEVTEDVESDMDEYGNPIIDRTIQMPAMTQVTKTVPVPMIIDDRFNYEILDNRNIYFDNSYTYSLQDKKWIIVREEKTLDELKDEASLYGYTNLDLLENIKPDIETDTSRETYNKDDAHQKVPLKGNEPFDIIHRYGKFWAIVNARNEYANPTDISIGIDNDGKTLPKAELVECIISFALNGSTKQLIRFIPLPFMDAHGKPYRPLIRGLCYIHPTKDWGLGDGKFCRELQIAINDTMNISNDRVMLATLPTLKGRKYSLEDNPSVYFEPNHVIPLENPDDLVEFQISDNIQGALNQYGILKQTMSGVTSIFPPALGSVPELSSTTATAVAGSEQNKSMRSNYRGLTSEHTFLNELYWMITQMTWQFATEETAMRLMGNKAYNFDPSACYTYKPLSQSIIPEYSKANQIRELNQMMSVLAPVVSINPKGALLINFVISRIFELYGDEYSKYGKYLLDENAPVGTQPAGAEGAPMQNQNMTPMSGMEKTARGSMGGY
mgnify:CR=1 FL=1